MPATWAEEFILGIDHVPVAVANLGGAEADYERLGFSLKPGRDHQNSIRNSHVKFRDGTEIELITATAAIDDLSSWYRDQLSAGDGPAMFGLYTASLKVLRGQLTERGISYRSADGMAQIGADLKQFGLFFAQRQRSPTDTEAHFAHKNTARSVVGIWYAGETSDINVVRRLDVELVKTLRCGPLGTSAAVLRMHAGEIVLLPRERRLSASRPIVGITVAVSSLAQARLVLDQNAVGVVAPPECGPGSIWVGPDQTHGYWLEFRQSG